MTESRAQTGNENQANRTAENKKFLAIFTSLDGTEKKIGIVYTSDPWEYQDVLRNASKEKIDLNYIERFLSEEQMAILDNQEEISQINGKPFSQVYNLCQGLIGRLEAAR